MHTPANWDNTPRVESLQSICEETHALPSGGESTLEQRAATRISRGSWGGDPWDDFCPRGIHDPASELGTFTPIYTGSDRRAGSAGTR